MVGNAFFTFTVMFAFFFGHGQFGADIIQLPKSGIWEFGFLQEIVLLVNVGFLRLDEKTQKPKG